MLAALIHMFPSTAMAYFRSNQNYISVKISTTIFKKHILSRQEYKHMSKVQGHCGIAKQKIRQQSFSSEKCCSSSPLQEKTTEPCQADQKKTSWFSVELIWNQRSSLKQMKVTGKKQKEPTTHISLEENNTSKWKWALTWTCNHTPHILNIPTPRAISSSDLECRFSSLYNHLEFPKCGNISLCLFEKVKLNKKLTPFSSKIVILLSAQRM